LVIICILYVNPTNAASNTKVTAPSEPTAAAINILGATELELTFEPSITDGGSEITSYAIEWDTEPGIDEQQTIQLQTWIGPNEIQTITTKATHRDEVQVVRSTAEDEDEIQIIKTSGLTDPNNLNQLGGWFTIQYDDTALNGGSVQTSAPISWDAAAMKTSPNAAPRTSMQEILENMQNVETVSVKRSLPDSNGGYEWTITFTGTSRNEGNIPQLQLGYSALTGTGADVTISTFRQGNVLSGTFTLALQNQLSGPIAHDASAADMQQKLEALPTIGLVSVQRSRPDMQGGYQWSITFIDQRIGNTGDVNAMVGTTKNTLKGTNAMVTVCTDGNSTAPCQGHSIMGNQIGGYFEIGVAGQSQKVNISFDATPSKVQTELETLPGVGSLNVQRTVHPDPQRGYIWTVSFVGDEGDRNNILAYYANTLTGTGATVTVDEIRKGTWKEVQKVTISETSNGNVPKGTFRLKFENITTLPIAYDGTNGNCTQFNQNIKLRIEALTNVGTVSVACTNGNNGGAIYSVTFDTNAGNLVEMTAEDKSLNNGGTPDVTVSTFRHGTSSKLSGQFTVELDGQRTGYMPYDITADKLKTALEALNSVGTVAIQRSDADENRGYVWSVTFLGVLKDVSSMIVDDKAVLGTAPRSHVTETVKGRNPAFNQGADGLPLGSATITDLKTLRYRITNLRQGVPYFARIAAINSVGQGPYTIFKPLTLAPKSLPPTAPTNVNLLVVDGHTLETQFSSPLETGGADVDQYRIEWHTHALVDEVQTIFALAPVVNEVQNIVTSATDLNEKQIIRLSGSGTGNTVNEEQSLQCYGNSGSFRITFRGYTTDAIYAKTTTALELEKILEADQSIIRDVQVTIAGNGAQTTICSSQANPFPYKVTVKFMDVPGIEGKMPLMGTDVTQLGGTNWVKVVRETEGDAPIKGTFALSFRGHRTTDIAHNVQPSDLKIALEKLDSIPTNGVDVTNSVVTTAGQLQYAYTVVFKDATELGGDVESLVIDGTKLTGNDIKGTVCADNIVDGSSCTGASSRGNQVGGAFQLTLLGHTTKNIPWDAAATTMKARLEELPNVGTVEVLREGPTPEGGYTWKTTFTANPGAYPIGSGNVNQLLPVITDLLGTDANVTVNTITKGSDPLSGTFTLTFDNLPGDPKTTDNIRSDATATEVKARIEELPNMGRVQVSKTLEKDGFAWKVTFSGCKTIGVWSENNICNYGDQPTFVGDKTKLFGGANGATAHVKVITVVNGTKGTAAYVDDLSKSPPYTYRIRNLRTKQRYYVRVSARNQCPFTCPGCCALGPRQVSLPLFAQPRDQIPGAPPPPYLVSSTATSIKVKWEHPTTNGGTPVTGYRLYMDDGAGGDYFMVYDGTGYENVKEFDTATKISTMTSGLKYRFKVQSLNAIGASSLTHSRDLKFADGIDSIFIARNPEVSTPPLPPMRDSRTFVGAFPTRATQSTFLHLPTDAQLSVRWIAPIDNGGSPVTNYKVNIYDKDQLAVSNECGQLEIQAIKLPLSTQNVVVWHGYESTGNISNTNTATEIAAALNGLSTINKVKVTKHQDLSDFTWSVTFYQQGDVKQMKLFSQSGSSNAGTVTEIKKGMCSPEIQTITVKGANAAGKYQLKMNGVKTDNIDISESETTFEAKLKAVFCNPSDMPNTCKFSVLRTVVANDETQYTIVFNTGLLNDLPTLLVYNVSLASGTAVTSQEQAPGALRHITSDLTEGRAFRAYLQSYNSKGWSKASAMKTILAANVPYPAPAPTIKEISSTKITVNFDTPADNYAHESGSPITGYKLYAFAGVGLNTPADPIPVKVEVQVIEVVVQQPRNEIQRIEMGSSVTGGNYTLQFRDEVTAEIQYNANAQEIEAALSSLHNIGSVSVTFNGTNLRTVEFSALERNSSGNVEKLIPNINNLQGVNPTVTVTEVVNGVGRLNEHPSDFTISFRGSQTPHIPWDASESEMKFVLENLPTIGVVDVKRQNAQFGAYKWLVTFRTEVGNLPMMTATSGRIGRPGEYGAIANMDAEVTVTEGIKGSSSRLVYDGTINPSKRSFDVTDLVPDATYAFKVVAINAVGEGMASPASITVIAREGASPSHTTASGTALVKGTTGQVFEQQQISITATSNLGGTFQLRIGNSNTDAFTSDLSVLEGTTDKIESEINLLTFDYGRKNINHVRVTRAKDVSLDGYTWSITFRGNRGDIPLVTLNTSKVTGNNVTTNVYEFVKGDSNEFIIEPKKSIWGSCERCSVNKRL
jgi:hypothetical protein